MLGLGIALIVVSTYFSFITPETNATTLEKNGLSVTVTPVNLTLPAQLSKFSKVGITIQGEQNFSDVHVIFHSDTRSLAILNETFHPRSYFVASVQWPVNESIVKGDLFITVDNVTTWEVPLALMGGYGGLLAEFALFAGLALLGLGVYYSRPKDRWVLALIPVYFVLSALYGQRYDDYYIISAGFRSIFGVDPYISSGSVLPGLQWSYPPGYVPWSYFVDWLYLHLPGTIPVTNASLNYIGTQYGDFYGSWRALPTSQLLFLYFLAKMPLVLSFFWIAKSLKTLTGRLHLKLWVLNPIAVVVGVLWGQLDVLAVALMLQSVIYYRNQNSFRAVLFASLGAAIKLFPFLLVPYLVYNSRHRWRAFSGVLPVMLIVFIIYAMTGGSPDSVLGLFYARAIPTYQGVFISNGLTWQVIITALGMKTFPSLFLYVFLPAYVLLTVYLIRAKASLETYSIVIFLLFFLAYNFVNPQYLIWIIPILIIARNESWAGLLSFLGIIYMALTYSYTYFMNPQISWNYGSSILGQVESVRIAVTGSTVVRIVLGIVASVIFGYMLLRMLGIVGFRGKTRMNRN